MKKIIIVLAALCILATLCGCATGTNVTDIVASDNTVWYTPKCPECKHLGNSKWANVSAGEEYDGIHTCESCGYTFDISIQR